MIYGHTQTIIGTIALVGLALGFLAVNPLLAEDHEAAPRVAIIEIDDDIKAGTAQFISRSIRAAEDDGAHTLVIQLNTAGGLLGATESISRELISTDIQTVVYAYREGGWVFSAGAIIMLSADITASHPTVSIGAASPVGMDGQPAGEKITNATLSWVGRLAERTGKDPDLAERLVSENLTVSGQEAVELGLSDISAEDLDTLLVELGLEDAERLEYSPNLFDHILSFLSLPYLAPLFLGLGALGLFLLFRTGEIESVGLIGIIFLLLGLWGAGMIELSLLGVLLLLVGTMLLAAEILYAPADFGILGVTGAAAILLSVVTFANEPFFPSYLTQSLFWIIIGSCVATAALFVIIGRLSAETLTQPAQTGPESARGKIVTLRSSCDPIGTVELDGERYNARPITDGETLPAGTEVRIANIEGNTILVERVTK